MELLYKQYGVRLFWIGGSLGADIWAAEAIIKIKNVSSDLNLGVALPFPNYQERWSDRNYKRMKNIFDQADIIVTASPNIVHDQNRMMPLLYKKRNYFMVDECKHMIAVGQWRNGGKNQSGVLRTIRYAEKEGLQIVFVDFDPNASRAM